MFGDLAVTVFTGSWGKTLFQTCFLQTAVEVAAAAAALPSPHTDNMAAAEEETHGSAASRRVQIGRAHV